jgi:hypothetical protein
MAAGPRKPKPIDSTRQLAELARRRTEQRQHDLDAIMSRASVAVRTSRSRIERSQARISTIRDAWAARARDDASRNRR